MKNIEHGTKEESLCPSCKESKNNCLMMILLIKNNNYLKKCGGYEEDKKESDSMKIEVGDILHTTNGDFLLISIGVCTTELSNDGYFGYGAIFIDDKGEYPLELQYMCDEFDTLVSSIRKDGKILSVIPSKIS